jgi:hypothetical protein
MKNLDFVLKELEMDKLVAGNCSLCKVKFFSTPDSS